MRVIQKVRFPIFYLNKITYRVTHEAEIQSHISFTSPHRHQVCLDTYHSDISICQVLRRKNASWARNHFLTSFWTFSLEWKCWPLRCFFMFGNRWKSVAVPNQDCMVDVEEFPSPRSSRDSRLWQHCVVEHCRAKELESFGQQSWSLVPISLLESL
jgi:hypothetical protein